MIFPLPFLFTRPSSPAHWHIYRGPPLKRERQTRGQTRVVIIYKELERERVGRVTRFNTRHEQTDRYWARLSTGYLRLVVIY